MTYAVGITIDRGLVFASDSRTNAGVDHIAAFSKMHRFLGDGERFFVLLSAGNLATTQAVVTEVRRDLESEYRRNLKTVAHLSAAAEYIGRLNIEQRRKHAARLDDDFKPEATFLLGGQIGDRPPGLFLIYPEGNFIRASRETPYLQVGELKYGKPILDRIIAADTSLDEAALCALVSMDSTMRSNATVGPPIEILIYETGSLTAGRHIVLPEHDAYLLRLRTAWQASLRSAFNDLPRLPAERPQIRLVDDGT
jgi:putative proteasome-type protease